MTLTMAVTGSIAERYHQFLAEKKQDAIDVTDLSSPIANRPVAEIILVQQALHAAGLPVTIQFMETPNSARDIELVRSGSVLMPGHTVFSSAVTLDMYKSEEVIPKHGFAKGVYVKPDNRELLQIATLDELKEYSAVSSTAWTVDWTTLQKMGLKKLYNAPVYESMIKMVGYGRGDFVILEFPAQKDLALELFGVELVPVPGIKIGIQDSRHFVVSRNHPDGPKVFNALERGLKILQEQGRIERYLREVGFYNQLVANWTVINL